MIWLLLVEAVALAAKQICCRANGFPYIFLYYIPDQVLKARFRHLEAAHHSYILVWNNFDKHHCRYLISIAKTAACFIVKLSGDFVRRFDCGDFFFNAALR